MNEWTHPRKRNDDLKSARRVRQEIEVDKKEEQLTSLIFGEVQVNDSATESISLKGASNETTLEAHSSPSVAENAEKSDPHEGPVWQDPDDCAIEVSSDSVHRLKKLRSTREDTRWQRDELEFHLRQRYEKTAVRTAVTKWARVQPVDNESDKDALQSEAEVLFSTEVQRLPPNVIDVVRLRDVNADDPCSAVLRCAQFYQCSVPDEPLLMTAGLDRCMRFYQINGEDETKKIHGIYFPKLPIYKASFLPNSTSVIATGRRSFFYTYDMAVGKVDFVPGVLGREEKSWESHFVSPDGRSVAFLGNDGYVVLIDPKNKQTIGFLKLNGSVRSAAFTPDGKQLLASGSDGEITRWDLGSQKCIERFQNNDGTVTASLAHSGETFAAGAESGVVNLYLAARSYSARTEPIKSIMNLPTVADSLKFNHDGQILAISSRFSANCLKLLHVPSRTIFSNFPTSKTPLNYVFMMDFAPESRYFAIGNDKGKCLLYKLRRYHS